MNWDAIGAIGEIIGALAVILTLFYLSTQIRHASKQLEVQNAEKRMRAFDAIDESFRDFRAHIVSDQDVAVIWEKARSNFLELEGTEKTRAQALFRNYFAVLQNTYIRAEELDWYYLDESVTPEIWFKGLLGDMGYEKGTRDWWSENQKFYGLSKEFQSIINRIFKSCEGET